jgi:SAM-dependent methyltransferase
MVNIGSGLTVSAGWLNVDGSANALFATAPRFVLRLVYRLSAANRQYSVEEYVAILKEHQFLHHDVAFGLPFGDESVDCAYSSHLLEHLRPEQAERLIAEIWRTLKSGGYVRICVPDLSYALSRYEAGDKEEFLAYFFGWPDAGRLAQHRYMYDFDMLRQLLEKAGFVSISRCRFREGHTPDIAHLDSRPAETLFAEAMKP